MWGFDTVNKHDTFKNSTVCIFYMHLNMKRSNLLLLLPFHRNHCFSILGGNSSNLPSWLPMYCNALVAVVKCILILVCIVARFESFRFDSLIPLCCFGHLSPGDGRGHWDNSIYHLSTITSRIQCVQMLTLKKGKGGTARLDYRRGSDRIKSITPAARPPDGSLSYVQAWCTLLVLV